MSNSYGFNSDDSPNKTQSHLQLPSPIITRRTRTASTWDKMDTNSTKSPRENFFAISPWTPLRVQSLHKLYKESPLSMQCNKSDGSRFQGNWNDIPVPTEKTPLPVLPRRCPE